jgi:hypothetical protein
VREARDLTGLDLDVEPLLELADGLHLAVGAKQLVSRELHGKTPPGRGCGRAGPKVRLYGTGKKRSTLTVTSRVVFFEAGSDPVLDCC